MILGEIRMHIYAWYLPIARISMNNNHSDPPQFHPNEESTTQNIDTQFYWETKI